MNKEQKRYIKEIKALMPVYGKYEKRFFHDIKTPFASWMQNILLMRCCALNWVVPKI